MGTSSCLVDPWNPRCLKTHSQRGDRAKSDEASSALKISSGRLKQPRFAMSPPKGAMTILANCLLISLPRRSQSLAMRLPLSMLISPARLSGSSRKDAAAQTAMQVQFDVTSIPPTKTG